MAHDTLPTPAPAPAAPIRVCERSGICSHQASALDSASRSLPTLKEGTYTSWSNAVRDTLTSVGLWKYVTGKAICPIDRTTREFDLYEYESVEQLCNTYAHTQKDKQTPRL